MAKKPNPSYPQAVPSGRKNPQRPIYDYDKDAPKRTARKPAPTRVSYGYAPPEGEDGFVPQEMPPQRSIPQTRPAASAGEPPRPRTKAQPDEPIRPIAAVTPAGRAQRHPAAPVRKPPAAVAANATVRQTSSRSPARTEEDTPRPVHPSRPVQATRKEKKKRWGRKTLHKPKKTMDAVPPKEISYEDLRRQRWRRSLAMTAGVVFAVLLGFALSVTVLFKIETIEVEFTEPGVYTPEQVTAALGFVKGDNLFGFKAEATQQALLRQLPYLQTVEVRRRLPGTVKLVVAPARESFVVNSDYGWAVLSETLKVLRVETQQPAEIAVLQGVQLQAPIPGQPADFGENNAQAQSLITLMQAIEKQGLQPVTEVNLTSNLELSFLLENRVRVMVGTVNELDAKLEWAYYLLQDETCIGPTEKGTLDVSTRNQEGRLEGVWRAGKL